MPINYSKNPNGTYTNTYVPPGPRPMGEDDIAPDYAKDRSAFEQKLIQEKFNGKNPHESTSADLVDLWSKGQGIKDYFRQVFRGRLSYADKGWMNQDQRNYWNSAVKQKRASIEAMAETKLKKDQDYYNTMLGMFDKEQGSKMAVWKEKQINARARATSRAKTDSKKTRDPAVVMEKVLDFTNKVLESEGDYWKPGNKIKASNLNEINRYRKAMNQPALVENEVNGSYTYDPKVPGSGEKYDLHARKIPEAQQTPQRTAPPAALEKLKQNPDKIEDFVKIFGYRPEGY